MDIKEDKSGSLPPSGKMHRHHHKEFTSDREQKRREVVRRHNTVRTPIAFRGQGRAKSAGVSRSPSMSSPQNGRKSAELLAEAESVRSSIGLSTPPVSRKSIRERLQDSGVSRSAENSPVPVRKQLLKTEEGFTTAKSPVPREETLSTAPKENDISHKTVTRTPPIVRRSPSLRDSSYTGQTYSYVGQSPLNTRKDRPYAARASRSLSFKCAQNGLKNRENISNDTQKELHSVANTPPTARKYSSLMEHIERSRVSTSAENSPALQRKQNEKPPSRGPSLRLSQSGGTWCSSRGLPSAILTDMHLFRKLYMVQLEKEARKEVEEQYAKQNHSRFQNKSPTPSNDRETSKPIKSCVSNQQTNNGEESVAKDLPTPRGSILKQTEATDTKLIVKSTSPTRKRVSFSAESYLEIPL